MSDKVPFEWKGHSCSTVGELGNTLCKIQTKDEAEDFWRAYVEYLSGPNAEIGDRAPESVAGENIGYLMGYYGEDERQRVYSLFSQASHPIFGRFENSPTPDEAFEAGVQFAEEHMGSES